MTTGLLERQPDIVGTELSDQFLDPLAKQCPEDLPCRVADADLWFSESPSELDSAKQLCQACPARIVCLAGALERREPWGVWGGEIFERGAIVARKRPRGRPRKDDREQTVTRCERTEATDCARAEADTCHRGDEAA